MMLLCLLAGLQPGIMMNYEIITVEKSVAVHRDSDAPLTILRKI